MCRSPRASSAQVVAPALLEQAPHDAAEADVARRCVDRLGMPGGRPIPTTVVRRAEVRASLEHLPWNLVVGLCRIVAVALASPAWIVRSATRFASIHDVTRVVPVRRPLPH